MDVFSCFSVFLEANLGVVKPMIRKGSNFKRMVQSFPICLIAIFRTHTHVSLYGVCIVYSDVMSFVYFNVTSYPLFNK